ncbi:MAG: RNA-guided endonuclease InsQ/TnpB family protein, partial [Thermoplasmata archaeon]
NLRNVTVGNETHHEIYDLSDVVKIKHRYRSKKSNFRRQDRRIRKKIMSKYGKRERNRVKQVIHQTSKTIVSDALKNREAIVLENVKGMRDIARK